jgi:hypothetical protein
MECRVGKANSLIYVVVKGKVGTHQWNVRLSDILRDRFLVVHQILGHII